MERYICKYSYIPLIFTTFGASNYKNMKSTALSEVHIELGAKMAEFAGYNMPIVYTSIKEEHDAVRNNLGVFDVSHMGEFMVEGADAAKLIQKVTSNDVSKLVDGQAQYSCLPNEDGGIVDDLLIYRFNEEKYMLIVNASNMDKDWNWITKHNNTSATMSNVSDNYTLLAVQGPKAAEALQCLTEVDIINQKYYTFSVGQFAGIDNVIISATGYTGSGGFEIYVKNEDAKALWDKVFEAGREAGILPIGLAARDTLRLEMGFCLYGNDINDTTSPLEAGLGWITKLKTDDFVGKDKILAVKEQGIKRRLIGFEMIDRGIPRHDYPIVDENENEIGIVTSGTQSPSLGKAIGLGYVDIAFKDPDSKIYIQVRNKKIKAKVVKFPFYKN